MQYINKTVAQALVAASILSAGTALAQYTEVKRLGTSEAVCKAGVKSPAEFQAWTAANSSTVTAILADAGLSASAADALLAVIAKGEFSEKSYAPGTKLQWMGANKKGKLKALPKRIWAGKEAFVGYTMQVTDNGSTYEITVPKVCCNFSLLSVTAAPVAKKRTIEPFIALMAGSESLKRYEAAWDMNMQDSSGFLGVRLGAKIPAGKNLSFVPALGFIKRNGLNEGSVYPESSAHIDFGLEKQISDKIFVGAGLGIWDANRSDYREASIFVNVGGKLNETADWFAEARKIDADDSGTAIGAGIRYKF